MVREVHYSLDETVSHDDGSPQYSHTIWEGWGNELMADWDDEFFDDPILPLLLADESLAEQLADREAQLPRLRETKPQSNTRHLAGAVWGDIYWPAPRKTRNSDQGTTSSKPSTSVPNRTAPAKPQAKTPRPAHQSVKAHIDPPAA